MKDWGMDGLSTYSECMQVGYKGELLVCCPGGSMVRHFQALGCRGPCDLETLGGSVPGQHRLGTACSHLKR